MNNNGYEASLERNKIYVVLPDKDAESDGDLRIVDESGEDYLFSADRFVAIDVPAAVKASLLKPRSRRSRMNKSARRVEAQPRLRGYAMAPSCS